MPRGSYILENLLFSALVIVYVVCVRRREERGILNIPKKNYKTPKEYYFFVLNYLFSINVLSSANGDLYPVITVIYIQCYWQFISSSKRSLYPVLTAIYIQIYDNSYPVLMVGNIQLDDNLYPVSMIIYIQF